MKKIVFDVMGNDNGVGPGVKAVISFVNKYPDFHFTLVGNKKEINVFTEETNNIKIINVEKQVDKTSSARSARDSKTSMSVAVNMVKTKDADAVISSGDSGMYLATTTLQLRRLPGIKRPAFMPVFPTIVDENKFVMMDVGANIETSSEMLVQWASLGSSFVQTVLKVKNPRVGIINIGTEENKGKSFHKEANEILKKRKDINYRGMRVSFSTDIDYAAYVVTKKRNGIVRVETTGGSKRNAELWKYLAFASKISIRYAVNGK